MHRLDSLMCRLKLVIWIVAILVFFTNVGLSAEPDDSTTTEKPSGKSPTGALIRSMLVPGWGQWYNGKPLKALVYAGAQLAFIYGAHVQNNRYHDYKNQGEEEIAEFYQEDRNRLLWWLFGTTLLSMGDAYVDAHLWEFDVSDDLSANISPAFNNQGNTFAVTVSVTWH